MKIECVCGKWHEVSPTGVALILGAMADGDLQRISKTGVNSLCIGLAFTEERVVKFGRQYMKNGIMFDGADMRIGGLRPQVVV